MASVTVLSGVQARQIVADISTRLQTEAFLSIPPAPPAILEQLMNCHLLFEGEDRRVFVFSPIISGIFCRAGSGPHVCRFSVVVVSLVGLVGPVQLAIEELCRQERNPEAANFVVRLASVDLEAACRAIGTNPTIWSHLQTEIRAMIFDLAKIKNVNAQWLASRCAAATGQPEFARLVFGGLAGHPLGSGSCFVGLPVESVFASLGPAFAERLIACKEDAFRLHVLRQLAESGTRDGCCWLRIWLFPISARRFVSWLFTSYLRPG